MSDADWTDLNDDLDVAVLDRGVTAGLTPPNGGGSFVYGYNSLVASTGAAGKFTNQVDFAPMAKGCRIHGCMKRLPSGGKTGFSPFLFALLQGPSVNDEGYLLGLADGDPYHLVVKKGVLATGVDDLAPDAPNNGILLRSTASYSPDQWHHLRMDVIVNTNGDVRIQVFENDLTANPLSGAPVWVAVPGMEEFVDDALQINSGSAPFTSGRGGFGFYTEDVTRRAAFDHVEILRQL